MIAAKKICRDFIRESGDSNVYRVLRDIDLRVSAGELICLVGRSGGGKTTLLNCLSGLLKPSSGEVYIDVQNIYKMDDNTLSRFRNENIGVIPQMQSGLSALTVMENVTAPARMYCREIECEKKAAKLLDLLEIGELANVYSNELSGGEQRRLSVARALINDPVAIFADEPTSDLDGDNTEFVMKLLRERADSGAAVIVATHDDEALEYADRIYRMEAGTISEYQKTS